MSSLHQHQMSAQSIAGASHGGRPGQALVADKLQDWPALRRAGIARESGLSLVPNSHRSDSSPDRGRVRFVVRRHPVGNRIRPAHKAERVVAARCVSASEDLRTFFSYDHETGVLVWIRHEGRQSGSRVGKVAGSLSDGRYLRVSVRKRAYLVHRVVWAIYYGVWPEGSIDHVNRIATDNRIINLRECTVRQNNANMAKKRRPNSTSIYKGVCIRPRCKRWRAEVGGVLVGLFDSELAAARAYDLAATKMYGEFAVLNFPNEER